MNKLFPLSIAATLALAGCASTPAVDDGTLKVVASTNVYGSIAESIGGDRVTVTSLITSAAQDPHSYEASAQDQLALSKADLVIENGGGYDPFIDTLLEAGSSSAVVVSASEASGLLEGDNHGHEGDAHEEDADGGEADDAAQEIDGHGHDHIEGFNEHVWYSLHGVLHVAEELAHQFGELDAANAAEYTANFEDFAAKIEALEATAEALDTDGLGVAITEPVPLYLLEAAGFTNRTPEAFSEAIEEGTDVSPTTLRDTLAVIGSGDVALLAYNAQTASSETEQLRGAAEDAGIPVVEFTETLPDGTDYVSWMTDNLNAIAAVLK
ncbi:ABC transporter substrate-binding protein [Glaciihabitans arcticus]|uniref:ABC transporter substrate-binding protein n=1 Tax=Glaciihabitans arcticus TaxID=2668039 RepID=A0A4Q9GXY9_9MICO|nr:zinc ABC transporter substrate-binding protein [Glaciihabitans arcticus]TBN58117.1 ABC transporter substrate-binding protein [Glaciihabitans arcticus]